MQSKHIELEKLERWCQILADTKKEISYDKSTGTWAWYDRYERGNIPAYHPGFKTWLEAVKDAIEPYLMDDEK